MDKKKILFVTVNDWANSGYRMCEAVNWYSDKYHTEYFAVNNHPFGYYRGKNVIRDGDGYVRHDVLARLYEANEECDIIHFKENSGVISQIEEVCLSIDSKPTVATFGGSVFRKHHDDILNSTDPYVDAYTVTTPDLIVRDDINLVPFAWNIKHMRVQKSDDCIIIGHSPSDISKKGSKGILEILDKVSKRHKTVFLNIQQGLPHVFTLELKRLNHIFIDQINELGVYGNSAVEAMGLGSALLTGSKYGADQFDVDMEGLEERLEFLISDPYELTYCYEQADQQYRNVHDYPVVCSKITKIYDQILEKQYVNSGGNDPGDTVSVG